MTLQECYIKMGGDYEDTMRRLYNEDLVSKFLLKFLNDSSFESLTQSINDKDGETAFRAAHTLKGICLNLGLTALFTPVNELTETLRDGWNDNAPALFAAVEQNYTDTVAIINEWHAN